MGRSAIAVKRAPGIGRERALLSAAHAWRGSLRPIKPSQARRKDRNAQEDEERRALRLVFKTRGPQCTVSDGAFGILSPAERALLTEKQDRLIELFVLHDEATKAEDWAACALWKRKSTPPRRIQQLSASPVNRPS